MVCIDTILSYFLFFWLLNLKNSPSHRNRLALGRKSKKEYSNLSMRWGHFVRNGIQIHRSMAGGSFFGSGITVDRMYGYTDLVEHAANVMLHRERKIKTSHRTNNRNSHCFDSLVVRVTYRWVCMLCTDLFISHTPAHITTSNIMRTHMHTKVIDV